MRSIIGMVSGVLIVYSHNEKFSRFYDVMLVIEARDEEIVPKARLGFRPTESILPF